jgi:tetraprenyl-beta-curcumene synthase
MSSASAAPLQARLPARADRRERPPAGVPAALARANARYWLTVAPSVREQLERWRRRAKALEDPGRRALALAKLSGEPFNPRLAATLATQAPLALRATVIEAIVAEQVAYDYRDALEERLLQDDDAYTGELTEVTLRALERLPGRGAVTGALRASALRCAEAQRRGHAAIDGDDAPLRAWARREASGTGLGWPEWLAGAQGSVLATHALIALAADERATDAQARALDRTYLSIAALTMLDSLIDRGRGAAARELDYTRWYESPEQMGERLAAATRDALQRARVAPDGAHHAMTLTGVVGYYASAPAAREPRARAVFGAVKAELGAALIPTLAVMRAWRAAKRVRRLAPPAVAVGAATVLAAGGPVLSVRAATGEPAPPAPHARAAAAERGGPRARASRSLRASDEAHLRYVSASGSTLYETGRARGTLPGAMRVHMQVGPTFSGSFTIYASGGAIAGRGSAVPHGVGVYESFAGSLTVTGGSGRFRHARGTAKLYGTFDRNTYALVIQTAGVLRY